jgi:GTP:adenosylcobinamide-phosphate guanylyltransferase
MRSRTPKVLHMICGRPMIDWVIDAVSEAGTDSITVVVNPHHAELAAHLSEKDRTIEVVYQREPKGTAHALQQVENLAGDVLVVNGDSPLLTSSTVKRVVAAHRGAKRPPRSQASSTPPATTAASCVGPMGSSRRSSSARTPTTSSARPTTSSTSASTASTARG